MEKTNRVKIDRRFGRTARPALSSRFAVHDRAITAGSVAYANCIETWLAHCFASHNRRLTLTCTPRTQLHTTKGRRIAPSCLDQDDTGLSEYAMTAAGSHRALRWGNFGRDLEGGWPSLANYIGPGPHHWPLFSFLASKYFVGLVRVHFDRLRPPPYGDQLHQLEKPATERKKGEADVVGTMESPPSLWRSEVT